MKNEKQYLIKVNNGYVVKEENGRAMLPTAADLSVLEIAPDGAVKSGKMTEKGECESELFYLFVNSDFPGRESFKAVSKDELLSLNLLPGDRLFIREMLDGKRDIDLVVMYRDGKLVTAFERRKIPYYKAFFLHLHTINRHRRLVRKHCFKVGLYWQGLVHDLSKYSPTEFFVGVKYFQGMRSPNVAERMNTGYSTAWMHHKGRNKHHYEYWTDYSVETSNPLEYMKMPKRYFVESMMDRIAASKVYCGASYTDRASLDYLLTRDSESHMNKENHEELVRLLTYLADNGEKAFFTYIKNEYL